MKKRFASSMILLLLLIPFIIKGGNYFMFFVLVFGLIAFKELFDLKLKDKKLSIIIEVLAYLAVGFLILNNYKNNEITLVLDYRILTFILFSFMIPLVIIGDNKKYNLQDALYLIGSVLFIGLSFNLLIILRNYSVIHLVYLLLITTFTDSFALITGKLIGKNQLTGLISPNKTIEGCIGGTIAGTFIGMMYYLTVIDANINIINLFIITITLSLIGQIGDLIFSQIKRYYHQKNFSKMIPGHGGVLDLCDSMIFVVITSILFLSII